MTNRFIKFIPSEEAMYLVLKKPKAFLLLTIIAERARRENGHPDGLKAGQCYLGDWKSYGFSEQEYRTAKMILEKRQHLKIIETCRTRKKSTTGTTTIGTLVEIISLTVYDINIKEQNDQINDRATTEQRPSNDEQERIRTNNNVKIKESITESVDIRSILSSDRKEEEVDIFRTYTESKLLPMPIRDSQIWFSMFPSPYIYEIFDLLVKETQLIRTSSTKKPIKNYLAWMQRALDRNYPKLNAQAKKCMELALHFQQNGWPNLQVRTRYAVDEDIGKDFYYDHENCQFMLTREYEKVIGG